MIKKLFKQLFGMEWKEEEEEEFVPPPPPPTIEECVTALKKYYKKIGTRIIAKAEFDECKKNLLEVFIGNEFNIIVDDLLIKFSKDEENWITFYSTKFHGTAPINTNDKLFIACNKFLIALHTLRECESHYREKELAVNLFFKHFGEDTGTIHYFMDDDLYIIERSSLKKYGRDCDIYICHNIEIDSRTILTGKTND